MQEKLFPTIHLFWKSFQEKMIGQLKEAGQKVVIARDRPHDSMGHSAKYGAYTIFCCTIPLIIHLSLVQVHIQLKPITCHVVFICMYISCYQVCLVQPRLVKGCFLLSFVEEYCRQQHSYGVPWIQELHDISPGMWSDYWNPDNGQTRIYPKIHEGTTAQHQALLWSCAYQEK